MMNSGYTEKNRSRVREAITKARGECQIECLHRWLARTRQFSRELGGGYLLAATRILPTPERRKIT